MARSSAKAKVRKLGRRRSSLRSGSKARRKRRGERGQPCLTPLSISIQTPESLPKKGETFTLLREPRTKRENQGGKPTLSITALTQSWSTESKAFAVSRRKR
jgi:hypothetical protein